MYVKTKLSNERNMDKRDELNFERSISIDLDYIDDYNNKNRNDTINIHIYSDINKIGRYLKNLRFNRYKYEIKDILISSIKDTIGIHNNSYNLNKLHDYIDIPLYLVDKFEFEFQKNKDDGYIIHVKTNVANYDFIINKEMLNDFSLSDYLIMILRSFKEV